MPLIPDIPYAHYPTGRKLLLDLRLPDESPRPVPVILFLWGRGWGEVSRHDWKDWMVFPGAATAAIDYRGSAEAIAPASIHDAKAVVRFLRAHAHQFNLDPNRIGALGGSAGGHIVSMLAVTPDHPDLEGDGGNPGYSSAVQAVCDECGPTDLTRVTLPEFREQYSRLYGVTRSYLGGPVEDHLDRARRYSPVNYITKNCPPILLQHVRGDPTVPLIESQDFHAKLTAAGVDATLDIVEGNTHNWDRSLSNHVMQAFFRRTLALNNTRPPSEPRP